MFTTKGLFGQMTLLPVVVIVSALQVQAGDLDRNWISDNLCNYCGSYRDVDVGVGHVVSAYVPGSGYPTIPDTAILVEPMKRYSVAPTHIATGMSTRRSSQ